MTHYTLLVGSSGGGLPATSFVELTSGSSTFNVPTGYNAIHIQYAVGGGGGAICGADYDGAGGESQGPGGGSGGYISDKIITVTAGETITYAVGASGTEGDATRTPLAGNRYSTTAGNGGNTTLTGDSTGSLITLTGGGGSSASGGSVSGPLRTNSTGAAGTATIDGTAITSGNFIESDYSIAAVDTNTSGPTGTFNDSGDGNAGDITGSGNCGGDNCRIDGGDGGSSYGTAVAGGAGGSSSGSGTNGTAGTRGSGGGGGSAQTSNNFTNGSAGGSGEIKYRFLQVI
jgi:hypothetical protein